MTDPLVISTAFIIGLLGSTHCIGMCGGIAAAVAINTRGNGTRPVLLLAGYNIGRISSYMIAGALIGLIGSAVATGTSGLVLRTFAALLLIAMGLYISQWWTGLTYLEKLGGHLWRHIQPLASRLMPVKTLPQSLMLGMAWGWLPCGLVYSTLLWSSAAGSWQQSSLLMLGFGLGTLPAMLATGLLAQQIRQFMQKRWTRQVAGLLIIAFGIFTLPLMSFFHAFH